MHNILVDLVCRPPRTYYDAKDLGPKVFEVGGVFCVRQDLVLTNRSSMQIHCSHYFPADKMTGKAKQAGPTVVYLHGNSGCRLEGNDIADQYLRRGMSFFVFDFGGCGNYSDGGMVTLGFREREDVEVALDYLTSHEAVSYVCVYGRSMGAATALLVAADDRYYHKIAGLVLDSCYVSVREVVLEIARKYAGQIPLIPTESVAGNAVDALRQAVAARAGFDIDTIDVLRAAPLCQVDSNALNRHLIYCFNPLICELNPPHQLPSRGARQESSGCVVRRC